MTTKTEQTKREMYDLLESMRKAKKHPRLLAKFESAMEAHFECLRWAPTGPQDSICLQSLVMTSSSRMREERDQIQQRLHAIDHAYNEQQILVSQQAVEIEKLKFAARTAGEELIRVQEIARSHLDDATTTRKQLSDAMVLVRRQRAAIGHLYMASGQSKSAVATLNRLGYTDCGGQLWKPPLGKKPDFVDLCINPAHHQPCTCGGL